jgi:cell division inhibitor SulA
MRAATALVPRLHDAGVAHVWRAGDLPQSGAAGYVPSGNAALDAELPGGGWPQGALTELLLGPPGCGELSLLVHTLAQVTRDGRPCVWVLPYEQHPAGGRTADGSLPYAPALAAAGLDLVRSIFVQPATPRESLWALEQSLRAPHLGALIGWLPAGHAEADFRALRRLHLLAGRHQALVYVLRAAQAAACPSPAALRLQLAGRSDGRLDVTLLKRRGRPLLEPVTLSLHAEHWSETRPAAPAPQEAQQPSVRNAPRPAPALPARRWSLRAIFSH